MTGKDVGHAGTYKLWGQEQMHGAIDAVLNEGMSICRAAEQYGVPKSSLGDRLSGRVLEGASWSSTLPLSCGGGRAGSFSHTLCHNRLWQVS